MTEEKNSQQNSEKNNQQSQEKSAANGLESKAEPLNNADENASQDLAKKVAELEEKLAKSGDQLLRTMADLENTRRRSREELDKTSKYAISNFVSELVLPIETFFLVCDNAPKDKINESPEVKHFADAVDMTKKELMKILEKSQVRRIFPLNEKFDHNFHEAIAHIESDKDENTVVQVIQAGYAIGDRLIRPALVGVSKGKA